MVIFSGKGQGLGHGLKGLGSCLVELSTGLDQHLKFWASSERIYALMAD